MSAAHAPIRGGADPVAAFRAAANHAEAEALVASCRSGSFLVLTHWPEGDCYSLEPTGRSVPAAVAMIAIRDGRLASCHDGLLDGAPSQTWRAA